MHEAGRYSLIVSLKGADFVGDKVQKILFELLEDKVSSVR